MIKRLAYCFSDSNALSDSVSHFYYMTALSKRTTDGHLFLFASSLFFKAYFFKSLRIIDTEGQKL